MCLGRKTMPLEMESKLNCFYLNTTFKPYLRLTRVKVEELYKNPQIVVFHDFVSDSEAEAMKNTTKDTFPHIAGDAARGERHLADTKYSTKENLALEKSINEVIDRRIGAYTGNLF